MLLFIILSVLTLLNILLIIKIVKLIKESSRYQDEIESCIVGLILMKAYLDR